MRTLSKKETQNINGGWIWLHGLAALALLGYTAEIIKECVVDGMNKCAKDMENGWNQAEGERRKKR